jgi:small subunit ribosomal protein S17
MNNPENSSRGQRKERVGHVISNKMTKTIVVRVNRRVRHARFEKVLTLSSRFYAHDEKNEAKVGDLVRIVETRPLSRLKRWRLIEIVERGTEDAKVVEGSESQVPASGTK